MALPPEFLDRLRQQVSVVETVSRTVRLTRRGREYTGLCPFHNEKTPSFTVSDDKGFFHCFGCGAHGDVIGFVMRTEGLSFPEAVEKVAGEAGLDVPRPSPEAQARERRRADLYEVVEAACAWFEEQLQTREGETARAYVDERGVGRDARAAFRLGFAPDRRGALRRALNARGIGDDQLIAAGLLKQPEDGGEPRAYFFNRLIFPIRDRRGRVIAFGGRALGDSRAKYLNSPETDLFHKGRILYNIDQARRAATHQRDAAEVIVCEGYMDVIALTQAGFPGAVAPLGTAITPEQIQELWRLSAEPVICLDGDAAGQRAGARLVERALPVLKPGVSLRFAFLPPGDDPDSLITAQGAQGFRAVLDAPRSLAEMLWRTTLAGRHLDTPERRAGLRQDLHAAVRAIADTTVRDAYWQEMEARFQDAFAPARGQSRNGGGWGNGGGWRGGKGRGDKGPKRDWERRRLTLPPRQPAARLKRRREQLLLAAVINHPALLGEFAEDLAAISFTNADLDQLRASVLDLAAENANLDKSDISGHLRRMPVHAAFMEVCAKEVYAHGDFAAPGATPEAARKGVRYLLRDHGVRLAVDETQAEGRRLANAADPESGLARLEAKRKLAWGAARPFEDEIGQDDSGQDDSGQGDSSQGDSGPDGEEGSG